MGARFVRFAFSAVLSALAAGVFAGAAAPSNVRLEPARVFNPTSESLLASLHAQLRGISLVGASLFNVAIPEAVEARDISSLLPSPAASQVAVVNLSGIVQVRSYAPPLRAADAPLPAITDPPLNESPDATDVQVSDATQTPLAPVQAAPVHFGSYAVYKPSAQSLLADVSVPLRVGPVHFNGVVSGSQAAGTDAFRALQACGTTDVNAACPYLRDSNAQSFLAGTDFNVRTGNGSVNVQLSSSVAHFSTGDSAIFPYVPVDPDAQFSNGGSDSAAPDDAILQYPGLADVVKHGVGARVAVPVSQRLTIGLQYDRSHYQGDYGNALLQGVDAYKDTYLGNVSYQLPNTSSLITLSARQYHYQDSFSPNFNLTQTRADLNFTVKF